MRLKEIIEQTGLRILSKGTGMDRDVLHAYTGDLLSDVMANSREGDLWITIQTHMNIIAVASLKNLSGIVIVNNRQPEVTVIKRADEEGIPLLSTPLTSFELSGRLYEILSGR